MREPLLACSMWLLAAGCFGPQIASGAFTCDPQDDPPCPTGFSCVGHRCVTSAADVGDGGTADLAGDIGAVDDAGAVHDLTMATGDLAQSPSDLAAPPDLRPPSDLTPPPDLATGVCGHAGAPCTSIQDCCSMYCRSDNICIGG